MAESVGIPVHRLADGREFITAEDMMNRPEVAAFVVRFSNYWQPHEILDGVVGPAPRKVASR